MALLGRRIPGMAGRMSQRLASSSSKGSLVYKGRIPRPAAAPAPPGPGETDGAGEPTETAQNVANFKEELSHKDYQKKYRHFERSWLGIICGTPIVIVTSWFLYHRVYLGEERKRLTPWTDVEDESFDDRDD